MRLDALVTIGGFAEEGGSIRALAGRSDSRLLDIRMLDLAPPRRGAAQVHAARQKRSGTSCHVAFECVRTARLDRRHVLAVRVLRYELDDADRVIGLIEREPQFVIEQVFAVCQSAEDHVGNRAYSSSP